MRFKSSKSLILAAILIGLFPVITNMPAANAHTKLTSSIPVVGSVVEVWPEEITLEFDEELQNIGDEKANFVVVYNAVGDQVSETDEVIEGNTISVTLSPNEIKGPVLVFYHVVSTDGHPVEGEYKFTFGEGEVTAEGVADTEDSKFPIGIYLASGLFITTGLFFAIYSYRRRNLN
jgi:methionine-rich copper-binding protein CopC